MIPKLQETFTNEEIYAYYDALDIGTDQILRDIGYLMNET